ncbi:MAG: hypothetical protein Q9167_007113 [Letrouitia subvulpina]
MVCSALVFDYNGRWEEAQKLEEQAVESTKKSFGVEDEMTLQIMANLASMYAEQERFEEAEELLAHVLKVRRTTYGENHPDMLDAEKLLVPLVEAEKQILGPEHAITFRCMDFLALTQERLGQLDKAKELKIHVLEVRKKILGPEHPDTALCMTNLAATYSTIGEQNKVEQLGIQGLEMLKRVWGPENPSTLGAMAILACIYHRTGQLDKAIQLMATYVGGRRKALGENHPYIINSAKRLHDWVVEQNIISVKADSTSHDGGLDSIEEDAGSVGANFLEDED